MDHHRRRKTPTAQADGGDSNRRIENTEDDRPSKAQKTEGGRKYVQKNSLEERQLLEDRDRARAVLKNKKEQEITQEDIMAEKRAANRLSAFQSRQRRKLIIEDLQKTVAELSAYNDEKANTIESLKKDLSEQREIKTAILRELTPLRSSQGDLPVSLSQPIALRPEESHSMYRTSASIMAAPQPDSNRPQPRPMQSETATIPINQNRVHSASSSAPASTPQQDGAVSAMIQFLTSQAGKMDPENLKMIQSFLEKDAQQSSTKSYDVRQGLPPPQSNQAPSQAPIHPTPHPQEQRDDPPAQTNPRDQRGFCAPRHQDTQLHLSPADQKSQAPTRAVGQASQFPSSQITEDTQLLDYLRQLIESQGSSGIQ